MYAGKPSKTKQSRWNWIQISGLFSFSLSPSFFVSPSSAAATLDTRNTEAPYCLRRGYTKNYVRRNDDKNECGSMSPISSGPPGLLYRDEVPIPDIDIGVNKNYRWYTWYWRECIVVPVDIGVPSYLFEN